MNKAALRLVSLGCLGWAPALLGQGGGAQGPNTCRLALPPAIYAVAGTEVNLYFQNVILSPPGRVWIFTVTCPKGAQQVERPGGGPRPDHGSSSQGAKRLRSPVTVAVHRRQFDPSFDIYRRTAEALHGNRPARTQTPRHAPPGRCRRGERA